MFFFQLHLTNITIVDAQPMPSDYWYEKKISTEYCTVGCGLEVLSGGDEVTFGSHPALLFENPLGVEGGVSSKNQVQDDILITPALIRKLKQRGNFCESRSHKMIFITTQRLIHRTNKAPHFPVGWFY